MQEAGEFTVFTTWPAFATARWRSGMSAPSRSSGSFLSTLRRRMADSFGSHQLQGSASGSTGTRSRKSLSERKPDKRLRTRQRRPNGYERRDGNVDAADGFATERDQPKDTCGHAVLRAPHRYRPAG